jgi:hypothetical protein
LFILRYGMVITDHFTGFTWGDTCADKVQDNLVRFLCNIVVGSGFGAPKIILSDNGGEVVNALIKSKK